MMSTYVDYKDEVLFYESPEDAFTYVKKEITPFVTLRHNYLVKENSIPFEFIIYAYKFPSDMDLNIWNYSSFLKIKKEIIFLIIIN